MAASGLTCLPVLHPISYLCFIRGSQPLASDGLNYPQINGINADLWGVSEIVAARHIKVARYFYLVFRRGEQLLVCFLSPPLVSNLR